MWKGEDSFDPVMLKKWGKDRMPHYQIPLLFVNVPDELPRNNMGKVNKKELVETIFVTAK